uniref:Uncharacterized protein n=1 Tax=Arundo donax TaxID=35708 RepID=A0A0A8YTV9_ARUDO
MRRSSARHSAPARRDAR